MGYRVAKVLEGKDDILQPQFGIEVCRHAEIAHNFCLHAAIEAIVERAEVAQGHHFEDSPYGYVLVGIAEVAYDVAALVVVGDYPVDLTA